MHTSSHRATQEERGDGGHIHVAKLSAICTGQPPTVISEVGPSAEGALFFQITRTNALEAPHGVLPAAQWG